jgi:hypothetical protein
MWKKESGGFMKKSMLVMMLLLALLTAGCQAAGTGGEQVVATTAAPAPGGAYPGSGAYPSLSGTAGQTGSLYPWYLEGTDIGWEQAVALINNSEVSKVVQAHDLKVTITLKDGRTLTATEPAIDQVLQVIQACGDPCKDIQVATE